jgi:hypothetical protein
MVHSKANEAMVIWNGMSPAIAALSESGNEYFVEH